jgi:hypothetical protein
LGGGVSRCYDRGMSIPRVLLAALVVMVAAGCASTPTRTVANEFEDIPMPRGLTYRPTDSIVIESPSVKAARLIYRGRIEPGSLGLALRITLEGNGWRYVNITSNPQHGTAQVYEKDGNALQVLVWEGLWFTYVELTASRTIFPPTASVK